MLLDLTWEVIGKQLIGKLSLEVNAYDFVIKITIQQVTSLLQYV